MTQKYRAMAAVMVALTVACGPKAASPTSSAISSPNWIYAALSSVSPETRNSLISQVGALRFSDIGSVIGSGSTSDAKVLHANLAKLDGEYNSFKSYLTANKANPVAMTQAEFVDSMDKLGNKDSKLGSQQRANLAANLITLSVLTKAVEASFSKATTSLALATVEVDGELNTKNAGVRAAVAEAASKGEAVTITGCWSDSWVNPGSQTATITPGDDESGATATKTVMGPRFGIGRESCRTQKAPELARGYCITAKALS